MPSLARGEENTTSILNWFIRQSGVLVDVHEIGFQVWDVSGGAPGTLRFPNPADPSEWEDVTSGDGHFGTGSYYAFDNDNDRGFTPDLGEPLGEHWIKWRWKFASGSPYVEDQEAFTVLTQGGGSVTDEYCTVDEIHDEGVPLEADGGPGDADILALIQLYSTAIDKVTRCFFAPRTMTLYLDGSGHNVLFMPFPIINVTEVEVNLLPGPDPRSGSVLSEDEFTVYNRDVVNDKRNPRIELVRGGGSIFAGTYRGLFRASTLNQKVTGTFGWLEGGDTPKFIKQACKRLVIRNLGKLATGDGGPATWGGGGSAVSAWGVEKEVTDRHSISYTDAKAGAGMGADATALQLINDPVAYAMIMQHRIATPAVAWSSRPTERQMMTDNSGERSSEW